ncbi:MAG: hypothetical protein KDC04_07165 [Saprospiraceae bacterium]|nr:hypothetical protein [Saprospiraceae bacterium]MCB9310813.1 hypothetical protein [Lewinellaceae bacterium]
MEYKEKIKYATKIAEDLQGQKSRDQIHAYLKEEGFYENEINQIILSAQNILGEKYQEKVRHLLVVGIDPFSSNELVGIDEQTLQKMVQKETQNLKLIERRKLTNLVKEGRSEEEALPQIDFRFLPMGEAMDQFTNVQKIHDRNSTSGRMFYFIVGISLLVLCFTLAIVIKRIYFMLLFIGIAMIAKGFFKERLDYED